MLMMIYSRRVCSISLLCRNIRSVDFSAGVDSRNSLRKHISPLLKLIHPDFFSQHGEKIQQENMKFLQSLNSLIDIVQHIQSASLKRTMCDITMPLARSYDFTFHVKAKDSKQSGNLSTRPIHIKLSVPTDLTFRQTVSSSVIRKRLAILLHRTGGIFEAVNITNPWHLESSDKINENAMSWGHQTKKPLSSSPQGFAKRSVGVSIDDPAIQALLGQKMVEKSMSKNYTSMFQGNHDHFPIKGDIDKYIRKGNIVTAKLSPVDELRSVKRVRDFFLRHGHTVNFCCSNWTSIIIVIDGNLPKNTFVTEKFKNRLLLLVSPKFQSPALISYLLKEVPQARIVLPSMEGLKSET